LARFDLLTLSLFIAVAEETSLSKAAEREHLAASAISKRLADLELNLNIKLFERKPAGMLPTAAGTALLHHARRIMRSVAELESELLDFADGLQGTVRVRANATAMAIYLPEDLKTFAALYPRVKVDFEEGFSPDTLKAVADDVVDIGIYGDVIVPNDLTSVLYRCDRLALLVPHDHELADRGAVRFAETLAYQYIGPPKGTSIDTALARAASEMGMTLKISVRTSGFDAITRMVDAGLGIAVVPYSVTLLYTRALKVKAVRLDERWAERRLMICVKSLDSLFPAAAALLAHLTNSARGSPASLAPPHGGRSGMIHRNASAFGPGSTT
jgi:DNA-binding transcriptional LysR family regulator